MQTKPKQHMHPETAKAAGKEFPDIEIARRIASGDQDAFRLLMRRHNQTLYRTARTFRRKRHRIGS